MIVDITSLPTKEKYSIITNNKTNKQKTFKAPEKLHFTN
jgi:hypothetical protein